MLSRRGFVGAAGAFAVFNRAFALAPSAGSAGEGDAKLRFGVISDVHLKEPGDEEHLLKAFAFFRDRGADGVMVAGDIADTGRVSQLKLFADAWQTVFPGNRGLDGRPVEKLFVYGNHCVDGWTWGGFKGRDDLAETEAIGYRDNRARVWEELFHEKYEPIWLKKVRGYTFIGAHWKDGSHTDIEEFLARRGGEIDPSRPFFYVQHAHPKDTCFGSWAWGHDDGASTRALSRFPNAVAFSGHSHYTLTDDRTVWQGAFTSINTASMKYSSLDYSLRDNFGNDNSSGYRGERGRAKPHPRVYIGRLQEADVPASDGVNLMQGRQGMLVSVYDDRLVIERREFVTGHSLGADFVLPLPAAASRPYAYAEHAKRRTAPEFPPDAKIAVDFVEDEEKAVGRAVRLVLPRAGERGGCRVFDYEVSAVLFEDDVDLVQVQRRFIAPDFFLPLERRIPSCEFRLSLADLKLKGHYRFRVVPIECFGRKGAALWSDVVEVGEA
ncbi:MAG: metallophosphoesterase [Kiritimatiellae bacterium]|nr:metallophosphoesterase [Kiritimatiellia bacterium]